MNLIPILLLALSAQDGSRPAPAGPGWKNVTGNVGGETWGYAGVTLLAGVPDRDEILAGVSEQGLWSSLDGGATWKKLGGDIKNRPHQILFDPKNPRTFWTSGCYGAGIFATQDGGATFRRLGRLDHVDGIAVDFSDPGRRTLLAGLHEQERSLHLSTDGGQKWEKIGDRLPEDSNFSTDPVILDSRTFLINTAGWRQGKTGGIYRSLDSGHTWTRVSEIGPSGRALVSGPTVFWPALWGSGLVKGTDKGAAWAKLSGPAKSCPIAIGGGRIAALADQQLYLSKDDGANWEKAGEPIPIKPSGVTYSPKRKAFYVWRSTDKKSPEAIFRWEMVE